MTSVKPPDPVIVAAVTAVVENKPITATGTPTEEETHQKTVIERKKSAIAIRNNGAFLYAIMIAIVVIVTVIGAVAQPASAPMICAMGTSIAAALVPIAKSQYDLQTQQQDNREALDETHRAVNGKMEHLLQVVGDLEHAKGKQEERVEHRERVAEAKVAGESGIGKKSCELGPSGELKK